MFNLLAKGRFYIGLFLFTVKNLYHKKYEPRNVYTNRGKRKAYLFYTDFKLMQFKGLTFGPFIWIYKGNRYDKGLHRHEICHAGQFYDEGLKMLQVLWSKKYELGLEIEAYAEQVKAGASIIAMAGHLSTKYSFSKNLSQKQAIKLLTDAID